MLESTVSPSDTLAIIAVAILTGSPIQPIAPITSTIGNRFGTRPTSPIHGLRNARAIITVIPIAASTKLTTWSRSRLSIRNVNSTYKPVASTGRCPAGTSGNSSRVISSTRSISSRFCPACSRSNARNTTRIRPASAL